MAAPEPQASTASSYIPIVTDATRLVRVLFTPRQVFEEQREKPTWFLPWLVIAIIVFVVGVVQAPYSQRILELVLAARATPTPVSPSTLHTQAIVGSVFPPIIFLIFGAIGAGILYLVLVVSGSSVRYRGMLSATIFAQATYIIQYVLSAVILRLRGAPETAISSIADAQPALGLNILLPADSSSPFLNAVLGGIGPLPIWGLIITVVGIITLEKTKKSAAWTAGIVCYLVLLLVGGALAGLQR